MLIFSLHLSICMVVTTFVIFTTACPPFTFKSTLSNTDVCHPCPLFSNTTENDTGATVCPCDPSYYRAVNEDDLPCTSECTSYDW